MAGPTKETAVRSYLTALKDPSALRDEGTIKELEEKLAASDDELERVVLRQQLIDAQTPSIDRYEEGFVEHAKAWADEHGVSAAAFASEGVQPGVLRRAGFKVSGGGRARGGTRGRSVRSRVSAEEVRSAIPKGTFTIKRLEALSGASTAVVRKVVQEEVKAGTVKEAGPDPDHSGPGRAPTLYRK